MRYDVRMIGDSGLPAGHDWALVEHGGGMTLFVKESHAGDPVIHSEAWAAYRLMDRRRTPCRQPGYFDPVEQRLLRLA